jgi:hypothetical protein
MRSSTYAKYVELRIPADVFSAYSTYLIEHLSYGANESFNR